MKPLQESANSPKAPIVFRHARVVGTDRIRPEWSVTVTGERITAVAPDAETVVPPGAVVVDAAGAALCPGFIDIHVHGIGPWHVGMVDRLPDMTRAFAAAGVTAFLPTVGMLPRAGYAGYLAGLQELRRNPPPGAMILGAHFESPYLNPQCINVSPDDLWLPDPKEYAGWLEDYEGLLSMMTLSPELPGAIECIARLRAAGVTVAMGHSMADQEQVRLAMGAGLQHACHLFDNVPISFLQRENCLRHPCMDEFALLEDGLYAEVIPDGTHVAPAHLQLVRKCKPPDRIILITDAQPGAGMPEGIFHLPDGRPYLVRPGDVARLEESGRIVGSSMTMIQAVQGYMRHAGADLVEAVRAAATNPARLLGIDRDMGAITPGALANLVLLDEAMEIRSVFVRGREVERPAPIAASNVGGASSSPVPREQDAPATLI